VHRADEEHEQRYDVNELRRAAFAADGFDPDRQVFVYQYFSHHAFATALREGRPPSPDVDDALRAHSLVEAAYRSAAERRAVELAELEA
jgi:predicted dehydrogenase